MHDLLNKIMPLPKEKKLYLQILSTVIEGRSLDKIICFNGLLEGMKLINDMLLESLGNHAIKNSFLNPVKIKNNENLYEKRLLVIKDRYNKNKFPISSLIELTKITKLTIIVECNKKTKFNDREKTQIIELNFRNIITEDKYKPLYDGHYRNFVESHKFALIKILFEAHKLYKTNNYILKIPT